MVLKKTFIKILYNRNVEAIFYTSLNKYALPVNFHLKKINQLILLQMKLSITIICFTLSCFLLNSVQANSSFPNALPKVQKEIKKDKSSKKSIRTFFKKVKKQNKPFSTGLIGYGDYSLFIFATSILCFLTIFVSPWGFVTGTIFSIISLIIARIGMIKDENPKLAKKMFNINLALLTTLALLLCLLLIL
jgi:hypothetical protein